MPRLQALAMILAGAACAAGAATIPLGTLDLERMTAGWGKPLVDRAVTERPLSIAGTEFAAGVGTHASSILHVKLDGQATRFTAKVGVDDGAGPRGTVRFRVYGGSKLLFDSGVMRGGEPAKAVDVDLTGVRELVLAATDGGDGVNYDHADWAEAAFVTEGTPPEAVDRSAEEAVILTPPPGPAPEINGPQVYGVRPGRPVIYRIPTTGTRPIRFTAADLPAGLLLDGETGILTGNAPAAEGTYPITFTATNGHGTAQRIWRLVVGDTIALTPPMGWNHWYTYYDRITDDVARGAADAMVASGMADVGYAYVSLDDCWMIKPGSPNPDLGGEPRDADGNMRPNARFPDMKGLTDYIHARGLKAGLYTSPGPLTCAGFAGSYEHEEQDAARYAEWGFDFLKYDWCSYGRVAGGDTLEHRQRPYRKMGEIVRRQNRDIVFNLCQYGMNAVWEWGAEVDGQCWRTAGDLGFELTRFFEVALNNAELAPYSGPGSWNDPDYLLLGYIGDATNQNTPPHPTPLSANEQYAYMSLWCLMASPLFFSGDMTRLDDFTLGVLCNPEVIALNQDPLGQSAAVVRNIEDSFVMVKELADGTKAIGAFNRAPVALPVTVPSGLLGPGRVHRVRDLWRREDAGTVEGPLEPLVPARGVVLLQVSRAETP